MLVFERRHIFIRAVAFLKQEDLIRGRAAPESWIEFVHALRDNVTLGGFFRFVGVVFPAAGVGAGALIRVTVVHIAGEQAAA